MIKQTISIKFSIIINVIVTYKHKYTYSEFYEEVR